MKILGGKDKPQTKPINGGSVEVEATMDFGQRKKGDKWAMSKSTAEAAVNLPKGHEPKIKILAKSAA